MSDRLQRIHQTWSLRDLVYRMADAAAIFAGMVTATRLVDVELADRAILQAVGAIVVYYLLAEATGAYRAWRGMSADREVLCSLATWLVALPLVLTVVVLLGHSGALSHRLLAAWGLLAALLLATLRIALRRAQQVLRARGYNIRRFAIVGVNELGFQLARGIEASPELGLKLIGFYDDRPGPRRPAIPDHLGECSGSVDQLVEQSRRREVDTIYITFPMRAESRIRGILERLSDSTASVYIVPDFFVFELLHSRWTNINGVPAVSVFENPFYGIDGMLKRIVDLGLGAVFLAMAAVPMLAIAAAVKLTSPGPVFFRQKRYGLDGREILVWKFRTMRVCEDGDLVTQATRNDPRITPIGAFLRKTSLDEVPQLFNVIEGGMSLVGPRPHANAHNEMYRKQIRGYMLRHKVKPGITGLAQVSGWRGETDTLEKMQKRIECDHQYIRQWSLWMDVKILLKTFWVVLRRQNAY